MPPIMKRLVRRLFFHTPSLPHPHQHSQPNKNVVTAVLLSMTGDSGRHMVELCSTDSPEGPLPHGAVLTPLCPRCTIRLRMDKDLGREDWLKAARMALLRGGVEAVRVEKLARALNVTKGSFYWHFKDREDLLNVLLREWEDELLHDILPRLKGRRGREALLLLLQLMVKRLPLGEQGLLPSDAAMFTWASVSPVVARRVHRAELKRIELLKQLIGDPERTELLYLFWLGFVARGQRVPGSRRQFPRIARAMLKLFPPPRSQRGQPRPKQKT